MISTGSANPANLMSDLIYANDVLLPDLMDPELLSELTPHALLWSMGAVNSGLVLAAEHLSLKGINTLANTNFYVARPRVFLMSVVPTSVLNDQVVTATEIDLLSDNIQWFSNDQAKATDVVRNLVKYGVFQHALETTFIEQRAMLSEQDMLKLDAASVSASARPVAVTPALLDDGDYPLALMQDVKAGLHVLVSPGFEQTWWQFNAETGNLSAKLAPDMGGSRFTRVFSVDNAYTEATNSYSSGGRVRGVGGNPSPTGGNTYNVRNGRLVPDGAGARRPPPRNRCTGTANEYLIILCNHSLPSALMTGAGIATLTAELVIVSIAVLASIRLS